MRQESVLQAIGRTPLVDLRRITVGIEGTILAKIEFTNPGGSVKDRAALYMIEDAERKGRIKRGGVVLESTSGNTGIGLAMVGAIKGYRVIVTIPDKMSQEKIDALRSFGAEVVITPTNVAPDDPRSYYSVAKKLEETIEGSLYIDQLNNPANPEAHYRTTGPEIWEQTEGRVTHFVAGVGTGGTISGVGKFLKEKNSKVKIIGVDPLGSVYYDYFKKRKISSPHSYLVEGIGEDIICANVHFEIMDDMVQVSDADAFLTARRLAREEGIFAGGSAGAAVHAAMEVGEEAGEDAVVVTLIPDSGDLYLSKIYNGRWMVEHGFLPSSGGSYEI